jgi:hypothetical protein
MAHANLGDYLTGRNQGYQPYGAGKKKYGPEGRNAPNVGPVADKTGYAARDARAKGMRNAALRKMKAYNKKNYASADALRPLPRTPYKGRAGGY